jgi:hypothetical protein
MSRNNSSPFSLALRERGRGEGKFRLPLLLILVLLLGLGALGTAAQEETVEPAEETAEPTAALEIEVISVADNRIFKGVNTIITVTGKHFTPTSVVNLLGVTDPLPTTFIDDGTNTKLQAAVPSTLAVGQYLVVVRDLNRVTKNTQPPTLTIIEPAPTSAPPPIPDPPTEVPIPTEIPGAPNLLVRSFNANPASIKPGDSVTFTVEIINQGTRTAQGCFGDSGCWRQIYRGWWSIDHSDARSAG